MGVPASKVGRHAVTLILIKITIAQWGPDSSKYYKTNMNGIPVSIGKPLWSEYCSVRCCQLDKNYCS